MVHTEEHFNSPVLPTFGGPGRTAAKTLEWIDRFRENHYEFARSARGRLPTCRESAQERTLKVLAATKKSCHLGVNQL